MRHAVVTFFAALFGVLIASFGFHFYEKREADLTRAAAEAEQEKNVEQGRRLLEMTIAQEQSMMAMRSDATTVSMARMAVAEFYMSTGRMPANNAEAGLPEPETYHGQSLRSLKALEGGRIVLEFDATSGKDGGTIEWNPDLTGIESMGIQWQCSTHDYAQIVRILPGCTYAAADGADSEVSK